MGKTCKNSRSGISYEESGAPTSEPDVKPLHHCPNPTLKIHALMKHTTVARQLQRMNGITHICDLE